MANTRRHRYAVSSLMDMAYWSSEQRVESITVKGVKRRGRPKLKWEDRLKTDLKELLLSEDMTSDRNSWRIRIRVDEEDA
ncbi:hypothetical protein Tco_0299940 [Tanacetum coccineum]